MTIRESILRLIIDSTKAKEGADQFNVATAKTKENATSAAAAVDQVNTALNKTPAAATAAKTAVDQVNTVTAKTKESTTSSAAAVNAFGESLKKAYTGMSAATAGATSATKKMEESLNQGRVAGGLYGNMVALTSQQASILAFNLRDVAIQLQMGTGLFRVFIQQAGTIVYAMGGLSNALKFVVSPLGSMVIGFTTVAGVMVSMISAAEGSNRTFTQLQSNFALTGRAAMFTTDQLKALVEQTAKFANVTRSDAEAAISEFSKMRYISGANLIELTKIIGDFATATGKDIPTAAAEAARGLKDPIAYVTGLSAKFGGLTSAQYEQIRAAQKTGEVNKAASLAIQYMAETVKGATENAMTPMQKALDQLSKNWANLTKSISNSSWAVTLAEQVSKAVGALAFLYSLDTDGSGAKASMARGGQLGAAEVSTRMDKSEPFDAAGASNLRRQFGGITQQRQDLEEQIAALTKYRSQDTGNWNAYSAAIGKAQAQLYALREESAFATDDLKRESETLNLPINRREAYRAGVEAAAAALRAGKSATEAATLAHIAEEKVLLRSQAAYNDQIHSIDEQIKQTKALTAARDDGALATARQLASNQAYSEKLKNDAVNVKELTQRYMDLKHAQDLDALASQTQVENDNLEMAQKQLTMVGKTRYEREIELAVMQKQTALLRANPTLTEQQIQPLLDVTRQQMELNNQASKLNDIYDEAHDTLENTFSDVLSGGIRKFSDFASIVKQIFFKMAAQIATSLIFSPTMNAMSSSGGGNVLFGSGGAGSGGVAGSGGGFLNSAFGLGKDLFSSVGDSIGNFGMFGKTINSLGTSLGFGSGLSMAAPSASFVGPMPLSQGSLFGSTTFGSFLGGAGIGAGIGGLMQSLGIGKQGPGSTIGGAIGGAIGSFIPIPVVGTLLGSVAGSLLGGLFGPKKSVGPNANANLTPVNGRFGLGTVGADNGADPSGVSSATQQLAEQLNAVMDAYGFNINPTYSNWANFGGNFGINTGDGSIAGTSKNADDAFIKAIKGQGVGRKIPILQTQGGAYDRVISASTSTTAEEFVKDLDIAKLIEDAKKASTALSSVEQSFKDLSKQADDYVTRAAKLGITQGEVFDALKTNFNTQLAKTIQQIEDPYQFAMDQLIKDQKARLEYATKIGADITQVQKLNLLEQQALMEQYGQDTITALEQMGMDLKKYLDGELLSTNSSLTPFQQFQTAQSQFGEQVGKARDAGGNADIGALTDAADTLLGLGKNALGGATVDYSALEQMVRSTLQAFGKEMNLPGFAVGGDFVVGGNGGPDSQVGAFRFTPGEKVSIRTPGQQVGDMVQLQVLTSTLQKELKGLQQEMRAVNQNLVRERTRTGVTR